MNIADIWKFDLRKGSSKNPREGACLLDAISWLEYGTLGDQPQCVCPVIAAFGRGINDAMSDVGRQRLKLLSAQLTQSMRWSAPSILRGRPSVYLRRWR